MESVVLVSWGWRTGCDEQETNTTDVKLCITKTTNARFQELRNKHWLRRDQHHSGKIFWEMFPQNSSQGQGCTSYWHLNLALCKSLQNRFEGMKRSWELSYERTGEATGENTASIKGPRIKWIIKRNWDLAPQAGFEAWLLVKAQL